MAAQYLFLLLPLLLETGTVREEGVVEPPAVPCAAAAAAVAAATALLVHPQLTALLHAPAAPLLVSEDHVQHLLLYQAVGFQAQETMVH